MSKKKSKKGIDEHIAELEEVMSELRKCAACGKPIEPEGSATCPHCGTPLAEAAELSDKAEASLSDLEKQLAETASQPTPVLAPEPPKPALAPAGESRGPGKPPEPPAPADEAAPRVVVEPVPEAGESRDLEKFIEKIEAQAGSGTAVREGPTPGAHPVAKTRRTRSRPRPAREPSFWIAAIAAGGVLYILALFLIALLGRFLVASFMVVATALVGAGIRAKPFTVTKPAGKAAGKPADDFVCPLCGTGVPSEATHCPTCGAIFERAAA